MSSGDGPEDPLDVFPEVALASIEAAGIGEIWQLGDALGERVGAVRRIIDREKAAVFRVEYEERPEQGEHRRAIEQVRVERDTGRARPGRDAAHEGGHDLAVDAIPEAGTEPDRETLGVPAHRAEVAPRAERVGGIAGPEDARLLRRQDVGRHLDERRRREGVAEARQPLAAEETNDGPGREQAIGRALLLRA